MFESFFSSFSFFVSGIWEMGNKNCRRRRRQNISKLVKNPKMNAKRNERVFFSSFFELNNNQTFGGSSPTEWNRKKNSHSFSHHTRERSNLLHWILIKWKRRNECQIQIYTWTTFNSKSIVFLIYFFSSRLLLKIEHLHSRNVWHWFIRDYS